MRRRLASASTTWPWACVGCPPPSASGWPGPAAAWTVSRAGSRYRTPCCPAAHPPVIDSPVLSPTVHCNESLIYVFPGKELRGQSPKFHIHVSVSDLYIPRIGPQIFLQQNRQTDCGTRNIKIAHRNLNVEIETEGCAIPFLGLFVSNFRYCVFAVYRWK